VVVVGFILMEKVGGGGGGGGGASIVRCEIYHVPEPDRYMVRKVYNCRDVPR